MAAATSQLASFETGHGDQVHDAAFDYYGKRLATCSSDRSIKVFDVVGEQVRGCHPVQRPSRPPPLTVAARRRLLRSPPPSCRPPTQQTMNGTRAVLPACLTARPQVTHLADLHGHEGPVWQVAWAHPKFGSLLASASFDHRVIVWKEVADNVWQQLYQSPLHTASVNSLCWAPYELGLALATAASDGALAVLTYQPDGSWQADRVRCSAAVLRYCCIHTFSPGLSVPPFSQFVDWMVWSCVEWWSCGGGVQSCTLGFPPTCRLPPAADRWRPPGGLHRGVMVPRRPQGLPRVLHCPRPARAPPGLRRLRQLRQGVWGVCRHEGNQSLSVRVGLWARFPICIPSRRVAVFADRSA